MRGWWVRGRRKEEEKWGTRPRKHAPKGHTQHQLAARGGGARKGKVLGRLEREHVSVRITIQQGGGRLALRGEDHGRNGEHVLNGGARGQGQAADLRGGGVLDLEEGCGVKEGVGGEGGGVGVRTGWHVAERAQRKMDRKGRKGAQRWG